MNEAKQATPHSVLIEQLMDSRVPKTEREHAASREIEMLREALRLPAQQAEKQELTCVCGAVWEGETMVCAPRQRVCSGCDKTNNDNSMWAVYCVDCWEKPRKRIVNKQMTKEEWLGWIKETWDAAQKAAWSEQGERNETKQHSN